MPSVVLHSFSDEELMQLIANSDIPAFDELYTRYWEKLFRSAYNVLRDKDVCQDLVQDVFVDLWNRKNSNVLHVRGYLYQSIRNQVAKNISRIKFTELSLSLVEEVAGGNSTELELNYSELKETIDKSMEELPEACRKIFYMSRFENMHNQEIANKLNISIRTVETQVSNALRHLRKSVKGVALLIFLSMIQ